MVPTSKNKEKEKIALKTEKQHMGKRSQKSRQIHLGALHKGQSQILNPVSMSQSWVSFCVQPCALLASTAVTAYQLCVNTKMSLHHSRFCSTTMEKKERQKKNRKKRKMDRDFSARNPNSFQVNIKIIHHNIHLL